MQSGHDSKLGYDVGINIKIADAGRGWTIRNLTTGFHSEWEEGSELEIVRNMTVTQKSIWFKSVDSVMVWDFHVGLGSGVWEFLNNAGENETHQAYEFEIGGFYKGVTFDVGVNAIRMPGADMYYTYFGIGFSL